MVIDMGYWTRVFRRIIYLAFILLGLYLGCKLAIFFMPFLIAFILSLLIEPAIRWIMKKGNLSRRASAIIIFLIVFGLIASALVWGITALISESSSLLEGLNNYFDKANSQIQTIISNFDFERIQLPSEVIDIVQNSAGDVLNTVSNWLKGALTSLINVITSIPTIAIYFVITILSLYFICTDKIYILDQIEHHLPKRWVKKIGIHLKEIVKILGSYLKAEAILIAISFTISLVGLYIFHFIGLNVKYPLLFALSIGFVDALPLLGSGIIMIPWAILSAINGDITLALSIFILWVVMSVVRQMIEPKIVSQQIGIHPIFTLIAMYTGFRFIGIVGMLIGPILLIVLKNIFSTLIDKGVLKAIFDR